MSKLYVHRAEWLDKQTNIQCRNIFGSRSHEREGYYNIASKDGYPNTLLVDIISISSSPFLWDR